MVVAIIAAILVFLIGLFTTFYILDLSGIETTTPIFWVILIAWAAFGTFAGFIAVKFKNLGLYMLGAFTGFALSQLLVTVFFI